MGTPLMAAMRRKGSNEISTAKRSPAMNSSGFQEAGEWLGSLDEGLISIENKVKWDYVEITLRKSETPGRVQVSGMISGC